MCGDHSKAVLCSIFKQNIIKTLILHDYLVYKELPKSNNHIKIRFQEKMNLIIVFDFSVILVLIAF